MTQVVVEERKLEAFLGRVVTDAGAAVSVLLGHLGDRLGLYAAMGDSEPVTPAELAARTGTNERLVQEWLANQSAGGYTTYDPETGQFRLPPEHAFALAVADSPVLVQGLLDMVVAVYQSIDRELEVFRTGTGLGWGEHHQSLFDATERAFRPGYQASLVREWIPAVAGLPDRLTVGAAVADVGCGRGATTLMLAEAYPTSTFVGIDRHAPSIQTARENAAKTGLTDRVTFEVADAIDLAGRFDLVAFFDAWHDTGDPVGVARAARHALADDGVVLLVEPAAGDRLEDNLHPFGRLAYGASTLICIPCSLSQGGSGLGQVGETRTRELLAEAGFSTMRVVASTPRNLVYEVRP